MTLKVIKGHTRPPLFQNHSSTFVYGPILMKICMNANITKTQFSHQIRYDQKCHFYVLKNVVICLTLRPSDQLQP